MDWCNDTPYKVIWFGDKVGLHLKVRLWDKVGRNIKVLLWGKVVLFKQLHLLIRVPSSLGCNDNICLFGQKLKVGCTIDKNLCTINGHFCTCSQLHIHKQQNYLHFV